MLVSKGRKTWFQLAIFFQNNHEPVSNLVSQLILSKPVELHNCMPDVLNFKLIWFHFLHASANLFLIPSVRECGKGRRMRGLDLGQFLTLETFHDRCLVLVLKCLLLTSSTFHHLSCCPEPKRDIYHPSVHYRRAFVCVWLSSLWPNTWQPSMVSLSAPGQTSCCCCWK